MYWEKLCQRSRVWPETAGRVANKINEKIEEGGQKLKFDLPKSFCLNGIDFRQSVADRNFLNEAGEGVKAQDEL